VTEDHDAEHSLVLPFDTDDPVFRRGVEIGVLWNRVAMWLNVRQLAREVCGDDDSAFPPLKATLHGDCAEMSIRIAEARDLDFTCRALDDTFMELTLEPRKDDPDGR
jgi:hypothetical protein